MHYIHIYALYTAINYQAVNFDMTVVSIIMADLTTKPPHSHESL
jgi:hypothetical protein